MRFEAVRASSDVAVCSMAFIWSREDDPGDGGNDAEMLASSAVLTVLTVLTTDDLATTCFFLLFFFWLVFLNVGENVSGDELVD